MSESKDMSGMVTGMTKTGPAEIKHATMDETLESLFNNLITQGFVTKDIKIGDMTFTMKALSTGEFLEAETVYIATVSSVPHDVVNRVRLISSLAYAIISINGIAIEGATKPETRDNRDKLHQLLMKLPPSVVDILQDHFSKLTLEQSKLYDDLRGNLENF